MPFYFTTLRTLSISRFLQDLRLPSAFSFRGLLFLVGQYSNMSYNLFHDLSYSIKLPNPAVHSEEVMTAVSDTLTKYYYEGHYEDYVDCYDFHKSLFKAGKCRTAMQSEKTILCEINACLWVKALNSAINSITKQTYPHYIIVKRIINYLLNTTSDETFGMVEEFFYKLLHSHPPTLEMFDYYSQIMFDNFVFLSGEKTEDRTLIFCLIEAITNCLKARINYSESNQADTSATEFEFTLSFRADTDSIELRTLEGLENFNISLNQSPDRKTSRKQIYFVDLPPNARLKRCFLALNFVYDLLETDFIFWLQSRELKPSFSSGQPLISSLLWRNVRDVGEYPLRTWYRKHCVNPIPNQSKHFAGLLNKEVQKILELYELVKFSTSNFRITHLTKKLVTLVGELIRCSDSIEQVKYPFVGAKCDNFFREVSVILYQHITELKKNSKECELLVNFKPAWLRLFMCSRLLSLITGYQCLPELTGVYDILEHIAHTENRSQKSRKPIEKRDESINAKLMKKLRRFKSINTKLRNGRTLLHVASEEDDVEKIKALLSFPELDVNAIDRGGWTALHVAAHKGNTGSIQELLSFSPKSEDAQKPVNTRARGPESITPLMCAVLQGHTKVCQLLLEHSGSVLLEDVNELNQTPLELSSVPEVTDVLQYYKKNNVWTLHSHKDINFDSSLKEVVMRLCVEMIQAYFCTYRTWDVYKTLKRWEKNASKSVPGSSVNSKWDYMRYHRDIKRNIYKLRRLIPMLEHVEEYKGLKEIYVIDAGGRVKGLQVDLFIPDSLLDSKGHLSMKRLKTTVLKE